MNRFFTTAVIVTGLVPMVAQAKEYTTDEMMEIVTNAGSCGVDVAPVEVEFNAAENKILATCPEAAATAFVPALGGLPAVFAAALAAGLSGTSATSTSSTGN